MKARTLLLCVVGCCAFARGALAQRYVCFGDSVTLGIGDGTNDDGGGYPARLEVLLDAAGQSAAVENLGVDGEKTSVGVSRIASVSGAGGDTLILMEGTNDVAQKVSLETTLKNLQTMVERARQSGFGTVLLATLIPRAASANERVRLATTAADEEIRELAYDIGAPQPETYQAFIDIPNALTTLYISDTVHPNPAGYDVLAQVFADFLLGHDSLAPVPSFVDPADGSVGISQLAELQLVLFDSQSGVDLSSATITVNDTAVATTVTGDSRRATLVAQPDNLVGTPRIGVDAFDLASPANRRRQQVAQLTVVGGRFLPGDIDQSGRVDGSDLVRLGLAFGSVRGKSNYDSSADIDQDDKVDGSDLAILAVNFGLSS